MTARHVQNALSKLKALAILPVLAIATACTQVPQSPTAGPGPVDANPDTAAQIFNAMCLTQQPGFSGTAQAATKFPFTYNSTFGTYYHNEQNLSVKLIGNPVETCSIVFITPADANATLARFGQVLNAINPTDDSVVVVRASRSTDGKNLLNARLSAQ
ncbi:hypothetical protein SAMN04488515_2044 [Cognatiyoonia koreensis]|uniref:Lipoprotein n=1 Tax=Cognatiyoonia koreensis TaxID=364200 RepID=A0A1I0QNV7_9RHOB|nr:hypothetical protein [Cognatiyoonia koreensis]SEW28827.1 hypothetical protein SAMN04488515_2044 [Cognatiyoonia koreensis]